MRDVFIDSSHIAARNSVMELMRLSVCSPFHAESQGGKVPMKFACFLSKTFTLSFWSHSHDLCHAGPPMDMIRL